MRLEKYGKILFMHNKNKLNISLIMNQNSYAGREYLEELLKRGIKVDVLQIGIYPEFDSLEEDRCGGIWKPKKVKYLKNFHRFYDFASLKSNELVDFLDKNKYDICIQGGTGIINQNLISCFQIGILNFHPGDLPYYRGSSAPEWQLWEKKEIISTCHLVDKGIDSGPILEKKILNLNYESYFALRASIYPQIASFVAETIEKISREISEKKEIVFVDQDNSKAKYRKYIGKQKISYLIEKFSN